MTIERRKLLQLGALGATGLAAASLVSGCKAGKAGDVVDIAIIGAGVSGMTAGYDLFQGGFKSFVVIEARDRVGGRTFNHHVGGFPVETGATWIGPGQTAMYDLCRELGIDVVPSWWKGDMQFLKDGKAIRVPGEPAPPFENPELRAKVEALAKTVVLEAPFKTPDAAKLDSITFGQYVQEQGMAAEEFALFNLLATNTFGARADQISLLFALFYIHSAGSYTLLETMTGGAQQDRIAGGTQAVTLAIAKLLGDKVRLNSPVKSIKNWDGNGPVAIETATGTIKARRVIMALSPSQAAEISFDPPLPKGRQAILDGWPRGGSGLTLHLGYKTPFWRKQGLSGLALGLLATSSILYVDLSPPDGSIGILKALGQPGNVEQRKKDTVVAAVELFGPEAAEPTEISVQDWAKEKYTRGCVSPLEPGFLSKLDTPLAAPSGALHWAGTETATIWMGYMDGAARAGRRAATEALGSLVAGGEG